MAKSTKLSRSNRAHKRLAKKHSKNASTNVISWIKNGYHNNVMKKQIKENRILTETEKKRIYRSCEHSAFN